MIPRMKVALTCTCQLKCAYCGGSGNTMENFEQAGRPPLDIDELIFILKAYKDAGGSGILITGGEPLLHTNLARFLTKIKSLEIPWEITTNGLLLTPKTALSLKRSGATLVKVSLDSVDADTYLTITSQNTLSVVLKNIVESSQIVRMRVNSVVTSQSLPGIPRLVEVIRQTRALAIYLLDLIHYPTTNSPEGKNYFYTNYINPQKGLIDIFEGKYQKKFSLADWYPVNKVYSYITLEDGFIVSTKTGMNTTRVNNCLNCKTFCQEGAFVLRLSSGGWLSFCPLENSNGINVRGMNKQELISVFKMYGNIFDTTVVMDSFKIFCEQNNLDYTRINA